MGKGWGQPTAAQNKDGRYILTFFLKQKIKAQISEISEAGLFI